ncbi:MAG: endolytic transglycosylase MltG [Aquabacterium sp.]|uniref:endolytic transglycosylase MltG n=1 Tax=Aquabacterium sp. TaxID=1872578 RepID=UPI0027170BA9|nr:endolytic transglycosylase MltG [Aquabacterium sp.]MDO9003419.1 endolytic transglycosylase MltG [Aquabacterium sp.]
MGILLGLLLMAALACAGAVFWWVHQPLRMHGEDIELAIESGTTPREIARGWVEAGVDASPVMLYQWFRWSGKARQIRAGSYMLERGATPHSLLRMMVMGDERLAVVKLIDGWTFKRFRAELAQADGLQPTTAKLSDAQLMAQLGNPGLSPEGQFFPDTYSYAKGSTDLAVLKRAHRAMQKHLSDAWTLRGPSNSCPLNSPQEMLILASIVEKETGLASDRPMIAGVFCNRLRVRMPLQTDPTVIYGMGDEFDGNLKRSHLQTDTPYNTYMRNGLPPTPIAMPGKAALLAAVHPAETNAFYFVSRGDGSSVFSSTLAEHNRAVNQYQRKRP